MSTRYLTALDNYLEPLYGTDLNGIIHSLPALLSCIKNIHSIARYYNTTERMTGLFCSITNQMIINCKMQITDHGQTKLWDQPVDKLLKSLGGTQRAHVSIYAAALALANSSCN